ncbi:hypothetical protein RQP46_008989 [Phenoliferia psychrophenolica]
MYPTPGSIKQSSRDSRPKINLSNTRLPLRFRSGFEIKNVGRGKRPTVSEHRKQMGDSTVSLTTTLAIAAWLSVEGNDPDPRMEMELDGIEGASQDVDRKEVHELSHLCHNPKCVRPIHLALEPRSINRRRNECKGYHPPGYACPHAAEFGVAPCVVGARE